MLNTIILRNDQEEDHLLWVFACENFKDQIAYRVIDLTKNDWLEKILDLDVDVMLAKPSVLTSIYKQLYDERIYILSKTLGYKIFPSPEEIYLYENKRLLSYWLEANKIPHPKTYVFYHYVEALAFGETASLPVVAKTNIGAAGSGVKIIHRRDQLLEYIEKSFSIEGAPKRWGPNFVKKGLFIRGFKLLFRPDKFTLKINSYLSRKNDKQIGFVIFQDYIQHDFEWRVVRIGDSFFAHKKLKIGEKASGSILKNYDNPSLDLLDFIKDITDKYHFFSQAIDIFETEDKSYLVNEMQCIFGQSDQFQMMVDGKIGRYVYQNNQWIFEEGDFNANESYDLRVKTVIELYGKSK